MEKVSVTIRVGQDEGGHKYNNQAACDRGK